MWHAKNVKAAESLLNNNAQEIEMELLKTKTGRKDKENKMKDLVACAVLTVSQWHTHLNSSNIHEVWNVFLEVTERTFSSRKNTDICIAKLFEWMFC